MSEPSSVLDLLPSAAYLPFGFALVLLAILIISFRSRPVVFCQYLKRMTGIELSPKEVRRVFNEKGPEGVRDLFLDLIIQEDLKKGAPHIPTPAPMPAAKEVPTGNG